MKLAIGFFDGVHRGHQQILHSADSALTFENHPTTIFASSQVPPLIMNATMRREQIGAFLHGAPGPSAVRMLPFTHELAQQSPADFISYLRALYPTLSHVYCGRNWTFGAHAQGTGETLQEAGIPVTIVPLLEEGGQTLSSTAIRTLIQTGRLADANKLLGRPWCVRGHVVSGLHLGHQLNAATINLEVDSSLVRPPCGVYQLKTSLGQAIANWGYAPTRKEKAWSHPLLEVHLLEVDATFSYTSPVLDVQFLRFIRPERMFHSLDDLKQQIARDCQFCKTSPDQSLKLV